MAFDAKADEAPVRARLRFSSPAGCGNAADFAARVQRRAPRVRFGTRGPDSVSVHIAAGVNGLDASVTLVSAGSRRSERRIEAETCEDALDALALVVAVTLEGQERTRRERVRRSRPPAAAPAPERLPSEPGPSESPDEAVAAEPAPSPEPPPAGEATPEAPAEPAPAPPPPAPPPPAPPPPAPPVVDAPPPARSSGARPSWRAGVGAGAAFHAGAAPSLMPGWLVYGRFGWELTRLWSPELMVSFASVGRNGFDEASGSADFELRTLSAELCPLRWRIGPVAGMPCALLAYGRLNVRGYDTIAPAEYDRPWTLLGASAQLALQLSIVELRAQLYAGFPLARDTFRFEPDPTVHRVPSLGFGGSIAAGLGFP
jgi:hypothetical protein